MLTLLKVNIHKKDGLDAISTLYTHSVYSMYQSNFSPYEYAFNMPSL